MNRRQELGEKGEEIAVRHLVSQGYRILERRYRVAEGEIDVIACRGRTLVFVEVKTRASFSCGSPQEAVTLTKQRKIRRVALHYLQQTGRVYDEIRFDVVGVTRDEKGNYQIEHIEEAF